MPFADIKQIMLISYHYMLLINKLVKNITSKEGLKQEILYFTV